MGWLIFILIILCVLGSNSDTSSNTTHYSRSDYKRDKRQYKKEMKRLRKAQEQAEMDAFEDMIMYAEAFMDD